MNPALANTPAPPRPPIASAAEGERVIRHMMDVMDALVASVEEETELVRAGRLAEAAEIEPSKAELSRMYIEDTARIRAAQIYLVQVAPKLVAELRQRHDLFRALLQINLTVLATAHAVSEGIMRGVSAELARKAMPQAYGASGHATVPSAAALQPLTVSRVL
jgi:hypothetical protein